VDAVNVVADSVDVVGVVAVHVDRVRVRRTGAAGRNIMLVIARDITGPGRVTEHVGHHAKGATLRADAQAGDAGPVVMVPPRVGDTVVDVIEVIIRRRA